jgi:hypothetical protein
LTHRRRSAEESFAVRGLVQLLEEIVKTEAATAERGRRDYKPPIRSDAEIDGIVAMIDITRQT